MQRLKSLTVAMMAGTLMLAAPAFAQSRGGHGGGGFSRGGGGFSYRGGAQNFGGHSFSAPARGYSGPVRGFSGGGYAPHYYRGGGGWGVGVGVYPGYVYPYGSGYVSPYYYDPYYAAPPVYTTPAPVPACNPNGGYYDPNGNWIPDPNCQVPPSAPAPAPTPYGY